MRCGRHQPDGLEGLWMNPIVIGVTARIAERSRRRRQAYLALVDQQRDLGTQRGTLSCSNLAHAFAASGQDKAVLAGAAGLNLGLITAYNDMLSAHAPYYRYPEQIKIYAREVGATAQVAGGVPAMCDGVTQGQNGMELSLFSRDAIALATTVGLSHAMFDGALLLGICDKIVPGLLIGALRFGHLPAIFVPAGPMPSGLPNREKAHVRQLFAEGKVGHEELLAAESSAYHAPGTCTFFGTANSNQMMMEVMGLHVPGAAFVHPGTKLRQELTRAAVHRLTEICARGSDYRPIAHCIDEKAIVNAAVGLLATGGSTNHTVHLPAIARAAGLEIDWNDFEDLSRAVPLIARIYPSGDADVNEFHAAGGMAFVIRELLEAGLLHPDVLTVWKGGMAAYGDEPRLEGNVLKWGLGSSESGDDSILRPLRSPFSSDGGIRLLTGNLGRCVMKTSAIDPERWTIEAPARIFSSQEEVVNAYSAGELDQDMVIVVRFQGPRANGMPELHKLMPPLGVLQDRGLKIGLVTDGRLSGASGKVPSAIHVWPEALAGGPIARLRDGDVVRLSAADGSLSALVGDRDWSSRKLALPPSESPGLGRELFAIMRQGADEAEKGGSAMLALAGL